MAASLGTGFVTYFFFSTLSLFADTLTGSAAFAGYLSVAYSIAAMITRPVAGVLSDRRGRVVTLIIGSAICTASCMLYTFVTNIVLYSFATGMALLLIIRAVHGVGFSFNNTSSGAIVPDIVSRERLSEGVGYFGMTFTLAQAIGPTIALAIVKDGKLSSFNTLYYLSAAICAVSLISGCFIRYERIAKKERRVKPIDKPMDPSINEPIGEPVSQPDELPVELPVKLPSELPAQENAQGPGKPIGKTYFGVEAQAYGPAIMTALLFIGMCSVLFFLTLYGKTSGFQVGQLGWFFTISACGIAAARIFLGRVVDKRGPDIVMIPGLIAVILTLVVIPLAPSTPLLICLGLPYGLSTGAVLPPLNALMFNRCSPNKRGAVFAVFAISNDVGITFGSLALGLIVDNIGFNFMYWFSAALVGVAFLIYIFRVSEKSYERRMASNSVT